MTAAMALSACGTSTEDAASELPTLNTETDDTTDTALEENGDDSGDEEVDQDKAMADFEACMADLGIDIGSPGGSGTMTQEFEMESDGDGQPLDPESMDEAIAECDAILEDAFGSFELSPEEEAEEADSMLALQKCLAESGFDIQMDGGSFQLDENVDFDEFESAMDACGTEVEGGDR